MKKIVIYTLLSFVFFACIVEESPSKLIRKIQNSSSKKVVISGYDTLGVKNVVYTLEPDIELVLSEVEGFALSPYNALYYSDYDSIMVQIGDSIVMHYNLNITSFCWFYFRSSQDQTLFKFDSLRQTDLFSIFKGHEESTIKT